MKSSFLPSFQKGKCQQLAWELQEIISLFHYNWVLWNEGEDQRAFIFLWILAFDLNSDGFYCYLYWNLEHCCSGGYTLKAVELVWRLKDQAMTFDKPCTYKRFSRKQEQLHFYRLLPFKFWLLSSFLKTKLLCSASTLPKCPGMDHKEKVQRYTFNCSGTRQISVISN